MPAVSKAQQRLMAAAEHGANFPMAKKLRNSMSKDSMHDFASGSMEHKPEHVAHHSPPASYPTEILKGDTPGIIHENAKTLKNKGMTEADAVKASVMTARSGHPHKNLGKFLHPKKKA